MRTLQDKKHALAKKARRDIADLVGKGRTETAKLRVEGLIQDDIYVELLELLEVSWRTWSSHGRRGVAMIGASGPGGGYRNQLARCS